MLVTEQFTADRDIADSLKLEMGFTTPEQNGFLKNTVNKIQSTFVETYYDLIPHEKLLDAGNISDRVIVAQSEQFKIFYSEWNSTGIFPSEYTRGSFFPRGKLMAFDNPITIWKSYGEEAKREAIKIFGSENKARSAIISICFDDFLAHEVIHNFQGNSLPVAFLETAARFYQRETIKKLEYGYLTIDNNEYVIEFYNGLVKEFGDDIHKVFFGLDVDPEIKADILSRFSPEQIKILFPDQNI
jgi:hypothetical protein